MLDCRHLADTVRLRGLFEAQLAYSWPCVVGRARCCGGEGWKIAGRSRHRGADSACCFYTHFNLT